MAQPLAINPVRPCVTSKETSCVCLADIVLGMPLQLPGESLQSLEAARTHMNVVRYELSNAAVADSPHHGALHVVEVCSSLCHSCGSIGGT
jgi:hypothetical protein